MATRFDHTSSDGTALLAAADRAMRGRDPRTAADFLERYTITAKAPGHDDYLRLAAARRATGDAVGALDAAGSALRQRPNSFIALLMGGSLLDVMGRSEEAARAYAAAIANAPDERLLPPPIRAQLSIARDRIVADEAWRASLGAVSLDGASEGERSRIERFRDSIVTGGQASRAEFMFPDLETVDFRDARDFDGVAAIEAATPVIVQEFHRVVAARAPELAAHVRASGDSAPAGAGKWSVINLFLNGELVEENAALCPETIRMYRALNPPVVPGRSPNLMFSLLDPHTRIPAHTGVANTRLVLHLPLIVPPACAIRVGDRTRAWEQGRALIFDDTIEHEAWNDSDRLRVVLLGDLWRPELSARERRAVAAMMAKPAA